MRYTQVAADAFQTLQLNAGILLTDFDPTDGSYDREDIFAATSGGVGFTAVPEYIDFGEDIDNVPANTMELKKTNSVEVKMSGTAKTIDTDSAKKLIASCDVDGDKLTPRRDLLMDDFFDIWWVGDYSDKNGNTNGGFVAVHVLNVLNTGGFSLQSNDDGKADIAFEFTGHYSLEDLDLIPYEVYIKDGADEPASNSSSSSGGTSGGSSNSGTSGGN